MKLRVYQDCLLSTLLPFTAVMPGPITSIKDAAWTFFTSGGSAPSRVFAGYTEFSGTTSNKRSACLTCT